MKDIETGEIREIVRTRLKALREESGLTQTELGEKFGKAKTTIASWEQGQASPDIEMLYRLATYYGKTISYMYGEEDQKEK